jgi:hypothetical protein
MTFPPTPGNADSTPDDAREPHSGSDVPEWAKRPATNDPMSEDRLALFIGPKWETTYRQKFAPFLQDPSFVPTWNWSAALATPYWFLYRKLYLPFVIFLFAPGIVARLMLGAPDVVTTVGQEPSSQPTAISAAFLLSAMVAAGGTGNWLLFRRARAATRFVALQRLPEAEGRAMLERIGGVHRGPTLILVLVAVTVLAVQFLAERGA